MCVFVFKAPFFFLVGGKFQFLGMNPLPDTQFDGSSNRSLGCCQVMKTSAQDDLTHFFEP